MTATIPGLAAVPVNEFEDAQAAAVEWALVASVMAGEVFPGRMRVMDSDGNYGWKRRKPLTDTPPSRPAAVELFSTATGTARVIAVDVDSAVGGPAVAAEHAAAVAQLLRMAGLHPWIDASPNGGRHVAACRARLPRKSLLRWFVAYVSATPVSMLLLSPVCRAAYARQAPDMPLVGGNATSAPSTSCAKPSPRYRLQTRGPGCAPSFRRSSTSRRRSRLSGLYRVYEWARVTLGTFCIARP